MDKVSVIIPARNEKYLKKTVHDVIDKAQEEIEIIVFLDGEQEFDTDLSGMRGVRVMGGAKIFGLKTALNTLVNEATGKYILKLDAHCSVGQSFDVILKEECEKDTLMIPSHYNLDIDTWSRKKGPANCYYMAFPYNLDNNRGGGLYPKIWNERNDKTKNHVETMNMVGCCWFMHRDKWSKIGGMDLKDSSTLSPESQELPLKFWLSGGKVVFNTATWYAHYWQSSKTRQYDIKQTTQHKPAELYLIDYFVNNRWPKQTVKFKDFINKFMPIPGWPEDWEDHQEKYKQKFPEIFKRWLYFENEMPKKNKYAMKTDNDSEMVSIVVPARNEPYLSQTIDDLFEKATGPIEVFAMLDGYWPEKPLNKHKNLHIIHNGTPKGMRENANAAARVMKGKYIMKVDAHCMFGKGFDTILKADCEDDWLCVPSRYSLNPDKWEREGRPKEYLYLTYPGGDDNMYGKGLHGKKWTGKNMGSKEFYRMETDRKDILIDDILTFQGSCWFMTLRKFQEIETLDAENYGFFQEAQETGMKVWLSGGRVIRNKKTWYAHWHKNKGRGFKLSKKQKHATEEFSTDFWMNDRWDKRTRDIEWLINKFWPIPGWPENWKEKNELRKNK